MGDPIKYAAGPASVGAAGTFNFTYIHDPKGKPSKIDTIVGCIGSGTQTGVVRFRRGNDVTNLREVSRSSLTAASPSHAIEGNFVIFPGQVISIDFSGVTAADTVCCYIGGH